MMYVKDEDWNRSPYPLVTYHRVAGLSLDIDPDHNVVVGLNVDAVCGSHFGGDTQVLLRVPDGSNLCIECESRR